MTIDYWLIWGIVVVIGEAILWWHLRRSEEARLIRWTKLQMLIFPPLALIVLWAMAEGYLPSRD